MSICCLMRGEFVLGQPPAQLDVTNSDICSKSKVRVPASCRKVFCYSGNIPNGGSADLLNLSQTHHEDVFLIDLLGCLNNKSLKQK